MSVRGRAALPTAGGAGGRAMANVGGADEAAYGADEAAHHGKCGLGGAHVARCPINIDAIAGDALGGLNGGHLGALQHMGIDCVSLLSLLSSKKTGDQKEKRTRGALFSCSLFAPVLLSFGGGGAGGRAMANGGGAGGALWPTGAVAGRCPPRFNLGFEVVGEGGHCAVLGADVGAHLHGRAMGLGHGGSLQDARAERAGERIAGTNSIGYRHLGRGLE